MTSDDRPVYLRLRDLIAEAILDGVYQDGDALPSVRAFAADQGANPLTVAKAYQSFQDDGLVTVRRGVGMFVAAGARERLRTVERATFLADEWPRMIDRMRRLQLDPRDLLAIGSETVSRD
jgi:GntR family transcriptional regulator